jgi:protein-tyrosine phosphatase
MGKEKVRLFLQHVDYPNYNEVPDPYYGSMKDFEFVFNMLNDATDKFIETLKK